MGAPGVRCAFAALLALALPAQAQAQAQAPPWSGVIGPATFLSSAELRAPTSLPIAAFSDTAAPVIDVGQSVARMIHTIPADAGALARLTERLTDGMRQLGFEVLFACIGAACGGFHFRFGASIAPPPDMRVDVRSLAQITLFDPAGARYVGILMSRVMGQVHVQTTVAALAGPAIPAQVSDAAAPEKPDQRQATSPRDAAGVAQTLVRNGRAVIRGLDFQTGSATLAPESAGAIDIAADVLRRLGAERVAIVGHSDTTGDLEANMALSRARAASVLSALAERGIDRDRMEAMGVGYLAPLTSNATPDGRSQNRRVEFVLR